MMLLLKSVFFFNKIAEKAEHALTDPTASLNPVQGYGYSYTLTGATTTTTGEDTITTDTLGTGYSTGHGGEPERERERDASTSPAPSPSRKHRKGNSTGGSNFTISGNSGGGGGGGGSGTAKGNVLRLASEFEQSQVLVTPPWFNRVDAILRSVPGTPQTFIFSLQLFEHFIQALETAWTPRGTSLPLSQGPMSQEQFAEKLRANFPSEPTTPAGVHDSTAFSTINLDQMIPFLYQIIAESETSLLDSQVRSSASAAAAAAPVASSSPRSRPKSPRSPSGSAPAPAPAPVAVGASGAAPSSSRSPPTSPLGSVLPLNAEQPRPELTSQAIIQPLRLRILQLWEDKLYTVHARSVYNACVNVFLQGDPLKQPSIASFINQVRVLLGPYWTERLHPFLGELFHQLQLTSRSQIRRIECTNEYKPVNPNRILFADVYRLSSHWFSFAAQWLLTPYFFTLAITQSILNVVFPDMPEWNRDNGHDTTVFVTTNKSASSPFQSPTPSPAHASQAADELSHLPGPSNKNSRQRPKKPIEVVVRPADSKLSLRGLTRLMSRRLLQRQRRIRCFVLSMLRPVAQIRPISDLLQLIQPYAPTWLANLFSQSPSHYHVDSSRMVTITAKPIPSRSRFWTNINNKLHVIRVSAIDLFHNLMQIILPRRVMRLPADLLLVYLKFMGLLPKDIVFTAIQSKVLHLIFATLNLVLFWRPAERLPTSEYGDDARIEMLSFVSSAARASASEELNETKEM